MKTFLQREEGSNLVEYALLVALVALVSIPALQALSDAIGAFWDTISARLAS